MIGPTSCRRYSNDVTIPKLPLPPRSPQNRSALVRALAVSRRPSAVTTSADSRLSAVSPHLRSSQPLPLPSVRPAMPVVENRPPVTASPKACVSRSKSPHVAPPSARAVDADPLHGREVDDDAAVAGAVAGGRVAAAAHGDRQPVVAGEADGGDDVGRAGAPRDQRGAAVEHAVPDHPRLLIAGIARLQQLTAEVGDESVEGDGVGGHPVSLVGVWATLLERRRHCQGEIAHTERRERSSRDGSTKSIRIDAVDPHDEGRGRPRPSVPSRPVGTSCGR